MDVGKGNTLPSVPGKDISFNIFSAGRFSSPENAKRKKRQHERRRGGQASPLILLERSESRVEEIRPQDSKFDFVILWRILEALQLSSARLYMDLHRINWIGSPEKAVAMLCHCLKNKDFVLYLEFVWKLRGGPAHCSWQTSQWLLHPELGEGRWKANTVNPLPLPPTHISGDQAV